ncbi:hypothetical protein CDD82_4359 [Ophiocordyceps australis]|uniref:Uncharacterized protein n=1 Tax=Ophiocordyceps australis TaxID=1399860 RepID=A0A2C5XKQ7_9HYPO|nr:hypothetical protein CDD82_4359 [Ophiocordyceps australis]
MVMTRSKRAKRILRCLSAAQHDDNVLSCSTTPLIRYNLLHNYNRCVQVSVDLGESADPLPWMLPFTVVPRFLRSQLEAQKIADGSRLWSQVAPLLTFIDSHLRRFGKSRGFPTLFVWHCRENHRSYIFFAFVEIRMVSKTYTARELLRLRSVSASKELYDRLFDKLRKDSGLGDVVRLPSDGSLPLIMEEEGEALGNLDGAPAKDTAARQLDGTDAEWKYRGRRGSEEDLVHPVCGPASLGAQKDEGFQRFYKAVVSPTHVRVTAGGRIVPNTRGSASPTAAKWAREKVGGDGNLSRASNRDQPEHSPYSMPQATFGAFPPMMPAMPGMHPVMPSAHPPFPMMPWHMGVNMGGTFGMIHPHLPPHMSGHVPGAKNSGVSQKNERTSDAGNSESSSSIRISPPEHFDHSRPFFYNGQWMMPPGAAMYPFGMPPIPGLSLAMAGQPMMHPRFGIQQMMHLQTAKTDPSMHSQGSSGSGAPAFTGSAHPPPSSIRQSEITKKQLENLRGHLKYLEDQLMYNKHQIDEKMVEQQRQLTRHQIQLFERNLEAQLSHEEGQHPKNEKIEESHSSSSSHDGLRSKSSVASDLRLGNGLLSTTAPQDEASQSRIFKGQKSKDRSAIQLPTGSNLVKPVPLKSALKKPRASEPTKKQSTLPVSAALAPPFQPRLEGSTTAHAATEASLRSTEMLPVCRGDTHKEPYLVGTLPQGCDPALAKSSDYVYCRELTKDELRARHMYWGFAPRNLQKGFPKFDGKDFYPPSPIKTGSSDSEAASNARLSENFQADCGIVAAKADSDPFASLGRASLRLARKSLTQSEHLPRLDLSISSTSTVGKRSPYKGTSQAGRSYDDFRKALGENVQASNICKDRSTSESGDDANILFKGRRNTSLKSRNPHEIWQTMLKKGKSSGTAVPGTVSSMTARGLLPNYAGHATASLTPAIANSSVSPKNHGLKSGELGDASSVNPGEDKRVENRPPPGPSDRVSLRRGGC